MGSLDENPFINYFLNAKSCNNINITGILIIAAKEYAINLCKSKILNAITTTTF